MSGLILTPEQLVDAFDDVEMERSEHWMACPDQRELYGCRTCARIADAHHAARKAMEASPEAIAIDKSV
jgi:hypothetical protein